MIVSNQRRLGSRLQYRLLAALLLAALVASVVLLGPARMVDAQSPTPSQHFQNAPPGTTSVPSGAGGVVVEGLGAGLGGCSYSVSSIVSTTNYFLNAGVHTVTEITPQSSCDSNIADWENVVNQIVTQVENNSNAPSQWAGVMLDEEDGFWTASSSVQAFTTLNQYTYNQVVNTPGITYFFGEVFSSQGAWSQSDFNQIMADPDGAPQIASSYMVNLTNNWPRVDGTAVTYGPSYPSGYQTLSQTTSQINGAPYYQWSVYWANCFSNSTCS